MTNHTPTTVSKLTRCKATNKHGAPCAAGVRADGDYCFAHDPMRAQDATTARRTGGINRNKPMPAPTIDLSTPELQRIAIEQTIDRVRRGDETVNVARLVIYAIGEARSIIAEGVLRRIEALERP